MGTPAIFGGNRYLIPFNRGIATTSMRTGLAMTALFFKQQFAGKLRKTDKHFFSFLVRGEENGVFHRFC